MSDITLLDVIDDLTKPTFDYVAQRRDTGEWIKTHTIEHPPLLRQLEDAASGRTSPGSGAAKHERSPIDLDAAYMHARISSQVAGWLRDVNQKPTRDPATDLRRWYVETMKDNTFDPEPWTRILRAWAHQIRVHFDPPKGFDAHIACVVCGATQWGDDLIGGLWPLRVEYRLDPDHPELIKSKTAKCRACTAVWPDTASTEELEEEVTERRHTAA